MSMLSEGRRKQKWTLNPRGNIWSQDDSKFGQKMLEKMGWNKGDGLGSKRHGEVEPISVKTKDDQKGIGFKGHDDTWIAHQDEFSAVLASLNEAHGANATMSSERPGITEEKTHSLEETSKKLKKRVHYHKFTRGKDLSRYSSTDLNCILGSQAVSKKRKEKTDHEREKEQQVLVQEQEQKSEDEEKGDSQVDKGGLVTINSGSVQDYFAKKMMALKVKLPESFSVKHKENENEEEETESKGRKRKWSSDSEKDMDKVTNSDDELQQPKKKKRKAEKETENNFEIQEKSQAKKSKNEKKNENEDVAEINEESQQSISKKKRKKSEKRNEINKEEFQEKNSKKERKSDKPSDEVAPMINEKQENTLKMKKKLKKEEKRKLENLKKAEKTKIVEISTNQKVEKKSNDYMETLDESLRKKKKTKNKLVEFQPQTNEECEEVKVEVKVSEKKKKNKKGRNDCDKQNEDKKVEKMDATNSSGKISETDPTPIKEPKKGNKQFKIDKSLGFKGANVLALAGYAQ